MQVGLDKLFDSDMNLIITVWRRLELFSTHSFRHEVGIYFHQLFDSVLCLICIFCNIDQKSVDLFQPKIPENSILFKIIIRSWWATKSISKVQSMRCFIVLWRFKLQVDKVFFFIFRSCTTHLGNCRKLFNLKQSIDVFFHHPDFRNLSSGIIIMFEISGPGYCHLVPGSWLKSSNPLKHWIVWSDKALGRVLSLKRFSFLKRPPDTWCFLHIRHTSAPLDRKQHRCVLSTCSVT